MKEKKKVPNALSKEKSPYLLQHAYNPVQWLAWGPVAFYTSLREDKQFFLSVGYSTCHWCHVMERESFEETFLWIQLRRLLGALAKLRRGSERLPRIFHVNWFRKDANGKLFMWPGFCENMRVHDWIIKRCEGHAGCIETPIGKLPRPGDLNLDGIDVPVATLNALLGVDEEPPGGQKYPR